jgi:hypothetical protein
MTQSKIRPLDQTATMGAKAKFRHPGWAKLKCQLCAKSGRWTSLTARSTVTWRYNGIFVYKFIAVKLS